MIINNKKTKANPNAQIAMILGILIIIYFSSSAWMAFLLAIYSSLVTVSTYKIKYNDNKCDIILDRDKNIFRENFFCVIFKRGESNE